MAEDTFTQDLAVKLSADELAGMGKKNAALVEEYQEIEDEKKEAAAQAQAKLSEKWERIAKLSKAIRSGVEIRAVKCRVVKSFEEKAAITYRLDTNEEINRRALTIEELEKLTQRPLLLEDRRRAMGEKRGRGRPRKEGPQA